MVTSPDLLTATMSPAALPPPTAQPDVSPATQVPTIENLGNALGDTAREALFAGARELAEAGASDEEISAFVEGELQAQGATGADGTQRSGLLVDMYS